VHDFDHFDSYFCIDAFVLMRYPLPPLSEKAFKQFKSFCIMKRNRKMMSLKDRAALFQLIRPISFFHTLTTQIYPNSHILIIYFRVHQRLEAQDFRSPSYVSIASIADKRDIFIKIHYDFEANHFDYWCRVDSPHIFPIGTCDACTRDLSVPYQLNWKSLD
jgi:hypothetical protein